MKAPGRRRAGFQAWHMGDRWESKEAGRGHRSGPHGLGQVLGLLWLLTLVCLCSLAADLAECKLVSFPIGIYKVLRNVTDQIHLITLANNELKSLTSKFMTTFCQLRGRRWSAQARGRGQPSSSGSDPVGSVTRANPDSWTWEVIPRGRL